MKSPSECSRAAARQQRATLEHKALPRPVPRGSGGAPKATPLEDAQDEDDFPIGG